MKLASWLQEGSRIANFTWFRSNPPEVFSGKGVLKICIKFTGEHPCWNIFSIKLKSHFGMGFSCKFVVYFQNIVSWNTSGGLPQSRILFEIIQSHRNLIFRYFQNGVIFVIFLSTKRSVWCFLWYLVVYRSYSN